MKSTYPHLAFPLSYYLRIKLATICFFAPVLFWPLGFAFVSDYTLAGGVTYSTAQEESAQAVELLGKSPAVFIENHGQWEDETIRFALSSMGANVGLSDEGVRFQLFQRETLDGASACGGWPDTGRSPTRQSHYGDGTMPVPPEKTEIPARGLTPEERSDDVSVPTKGRSTRRMLEFAARFEGARRVVPEGQARSEQVFHYRLGEGARWRENVSSWDAVVYRNLYNGIDLRVTGKRTGIKFEFIVAPGADWRQIRVRYDGIENLALRDDGSLEIHPGERWAPLVDTAPYIYQEIDGQRHPVEGRFVLVDSKSWRFEIQGDYDPTRKLIIDPELEWSTYLGGSDYDYGYGIAVDGSGNIVVTGWTTSIGWVSGGFDTSHNGSDDAFVAKLSPQGAPLWSTYLGGSSYDSGYGIAVDGSANIVVTGSTRSSGWVSGAFDTTYNGDRDAFVAKLSPSGAHLWSTYLGGTDSDWGNGIAMDGSGNIVVTGSSRSSGWVSGGFDTTFKGERDAFVAKLSAAGAHLWSTYLGGSDTDYGSGIAVDGSGNIVLTGSSHSSGWVSGGFDTTYNGGGDVLVAKLSPQGAHLWSSYLGGSDLDWGEGIAVDGSGNIVVSGFTDSSGWVAGGFDTTYNGNQDAFVAKIRVYIEPSPIVYYTFVSDEEGWTTGAATTVFTPPDFAWEPDFLTMTSQTNTNTFGFWRSPQDAVSADSDYLYRARFNVSTDLTAKWLVPQIRLSANSLNLQQYDALSIESAGDGGASPSPSGTNYDLYFVPPANDMAAMLAFDLLNFNPDDAAVAELALDTVTVDRFALDSLAPATVVWDYTFDLSTDGWTTGGAPIFFSAPQYTHAAGALELRATTNTDTFGFWASDPADITIEANRLYRGTFEVRTDVTNPALVPEMRLRFNTGNFQASHTFGVHSAGDGASSPGTTNTTYDRLYFLPPANCVGEDLLISFDILNFDPNDAAEASLILDRAIIETLPLPALP